MTNYELNQDESAILHAGRTAFLLGVLPNANPYRRNNHFSKLWSVGYKKAKVEDEKKRDSKGRYRIYFEPIVENPVCVRCMIKVPNSYCPICGDEYLSTELEEKKRG